MITLNYTIDETDSLVVGNNKTSNFYFCDYWRKQPDNSLKQIATICADTLKELFSKMLFEGRFFQNYKSKSIIDIVDFYFVAKKFWGVQ